MNLQGHSSRDALRRKEICQRLLWWEKRGELLLSVFFDGWFGERLGEGRKETVFVSRRCQNWD